MPDLLARARRPEELGALRGIVHDGWFDLDAVRHLRGDGRVEIPFAPLRGPVRELRRRTTLDELLLVIEHVVEVTVDDRAQIGRYDIADLAVSGGPTVVLTSGFPCGIEVAVSALDVRVVGGSILRQT